MQLEPFTYYSEKESRLIHTVAPIVGCENIPANYGSAEGFGMHQERPLDRNVLDERLPEIDALSLFCNRTDPEGMAETHLMPFKNLPQEWLAKHIDTLMAPEFIVPRGRTTPPSKTELIAPILTFDTEGNPAWCVNLNGMRGATHRAEVALAALEEVFEHHRDRFPSRPGTALFINNKICLHTRGTGFAVHGDGFDRWLLRSYWAASARARIIHDI